MNVNKVLTQDIIETSLKRKFQQPVKVLGYSLEPVVPPGENYTSDLLRGKVTVLKEDDNSKECVTIIIKCAPQGGPMEALGKEMNLFQTEIEMFSKTLPAIYRVFGEKATLSSELYYAQSEDPAFLILQDLKSLNYVMHERQQGLNLEHSLLLLKKLSKLHAGSIVLADKDIAYVKNYNKGIYCESEMIKQWVLLAVKALVEAAEKWPTCEEIAKKIKKMDTSVLRRVLESTRRKLHGFNVLNHGDLWINNFMFQYHPDGKLKNILMIDLQLSIYTSPAIDLHYFLATSPADKVKEENWDVMLEYYYANLLQNLTKVQFSLKKVPTLKEFLEDFKDRAFYGFIAASTVGPLIKASQRKDATFEDLMSKDGEDSFRHHCYNNNKYRNMMEHLLPYYDSLGVFD